jgi:hypothetical protein
LHLCTEEESNSETDSVDHSLLGDLTIILPKATQKHSVISVLIHSHNKAIVGYWFLSSINIIVPIVYKAFADVSSEGLGDSDVTLAAFLPAWFSVMWHVGTGLKMRYGTQGTWWP